MSDKKIKNGVETVDNQTTIMSKKEFEGDLEETVRVSDEETIQVDGEKTIYGRTNLLFKPGDIQKKIKEDINDIPDVDPEELTAAGMSKVFETLFPGKTRAEQMEINRKFLKDAEPFRLERIIEDLQQTGEGMKTGFADLDQALRLPMGALTVITGGLLHGKSVFILNLLLNMARIYKNKHFMLYTYEGSRREAEAKMINICGDIPFPGEDASMTNLARWKHELRTGDIHALNALAQKDPAYKGLKGFMGLADRIHVVDRSYASKELVDSIKSFSNAFPLGAVFVDSLQNITSRTAQGRHAGEQSYQETAEQLRKAAHEMKIALVCTSRFPKPSPDMPEYDSLLQGGLETAQELGRSSSLIIGLQNYSRSARVGSNKEHPFHSKFFPDPLIKAQKMPPAFTLPLGRTCMRVKVLVNKEGLEPETELLFDRKLLKLSQLTVKDIAGFQM